MRRPRTCLASTDPGGLGEPSEPTTRLCLQWLDGTGEGWGNLPGWRACSRLRPEVRPQGQKSLRWSVRKALFVATKARFSALHLPSKGGDQPKAQTRAAAREREVVAV